MALVLKLGAVSKTPALFTVTSCWADDSGLSHCPFICCSCTCPIPCVFVNERAYSGYPGYSLDPLYLIPRKDHRSFMWQHRPFRADRCIRPTHRPPFGPLELPSSPLYIIKGDPAETEAPHTDICSRFDWNKREPWTPREPCLCPRKPVRKWQVRDFWGNCYLFLYILGLHQLDLNGKNLINADWNVCPNMVVQFTIVISWVSLKLCCSSLSSAGERMIKAELNASPFVNIYFRTTGESSN